MISYGAKKYIETLLESAKEGSYAQKWLKEVNESLPTEDCYKNLPSVQSEAKSDADMRTKTESEE